MPFCPKPIKASSYTMVSEAEVLWLSFHRVRLLSSPITTPTLPIHAEGLQCPALMEGTYGAASPPNH